MNSRVVLDASVVIKALVQDESGYKKARELINNHVVVPEWLFVEIANVVATKTRYTVDEASELLELVYEIGFSVEKVDRKLLKKASIQAKKYGVAVYDMIYAVLAQELGIELVTADGNFARKTRFNFVKVLE